MTHIPGPWSKLHTSPVYLSLCPQVTRPALMLRLCPVHSDAEEPSLQLSGKVLAPCGLQLGGLPLLWQGLGDSHVHTEMIPALPLFLLSCEVQFVGMEAAWLTLVALSLPHFSTNPHYILTNIWMGSFPILGSSCRNPICPKMEHLF